MTYRTYLRVGLRVLAVAACLSLASYSSQASAGTVYGIDDQNNLFTFDHLTPQNIIDGVFLSGLGANERLVGIDFRPSDSKLYGIGSSAKLYEVDPVTGICLPIGAGFGSPLSGNSFGMDFNPVVDLVRFYGDTDNNLRISPVSGLIAGTDTELAYKAGDPNFGVNPNVIGAGYTNSLNPLPPNTTTVLYGIDSNTNSLVTFDGNPNGGVLLTVAALGGGLNPDNFVGFDISTVDANNFAIASLASGGNSSLYSVNLTTGATFNFGQIIGGVRVVDIALTPGVVFNVPEPSTIVMLVLGGLGMCAIRRRKAAK